MKVFKIANRRANKLKGLDEVGFENEREIQHITEKNLQDILQLDFVCTEFSVKGRRIDTLAFDEEANSFVIIEYKNRKNHSVVDQGMNYLSLMLENRAEFVLKYNEEKKATTRKNQIDWPQSRVVFISSAFTLSQKGSTNFKDFPVELWEVKKYENDIVIYQQVEKSAQTSIKELSVRELSDKGKKTATEEKSIGRVIREIKVYTEADHFEKGSPETVDLYDKFRLEVLNLNENIKTKANKHYINFIAPAKIAMVIIQKKQLKIWINMPKDELDDPKEIMRDTSEVGSWPSADYDTSITSKTSEKDLYYILGLVEQSLEYKGKKRSVRTR